jgi:putative FmdB family regulatory protein
MPVYDYDCAACGRRFEVVHGVHVDGPTSCPLCGKGPVRKAISAPAIHYKGSGWAKKERRATVTSGSGKSGAEGASGEGASGEGASGDEAGSKTGDASSDSPASAKTTTASTSTSTKAPGVGTTSSKD